MVGAADRTQPNPGGRHVGSEVLGSLLLELSREDLPKSHSKPGQSPWASPAPSQALQKTDRQTWASQASHGGWGWWEV